MTLTVHRAGPGVSVQDMGRAGHLGAGLARGGAADRLALLEAAALLGAPGPLAAVEMAGTGGLITTDVPERLCLTGAVMRASLDGAALGWNRTLRLDPGQRLEIGPATSGTYGYLTPRGGIATGLLLGSRSAHGSAGLGRRLEGGDTLPTGGHEGEDDGDVTMDVADRLHGGTVRIMAGPQTGFFAPEVLARFLDTAFARSPQANRQGVRLDHDGAPFATNAQLDLLSDFIVPGDIQMSGAGLPFVLSAECQTIGGYPRIGTVLPADLPRVAQAPPGAPLRFRMLSAEEACALPSEARTLETLRRLVRPLVRDPRDMRDLGSYQLIGGVTAGHET